MSSETLSHPETRQYHFVDDINWKDNLQGQGKAEEIWGEASETSNFHQMLTKTDPAFQEHD